MKRPTEQRSQKKVSLLAHNRWVGNNDTFLQMDGSGLSSHVVECLMRKYEDQSWSRSHQIWVKDRTGLNFQALDQTGLSNTNHQGGWWWGKRLWWEQTCDVAVFEPHYPIWIIILPIQFLQNLVMHAEYNPILVPFLQIKVISAGIQGALKTTEINVLLFLINSPGESRWNPGGIQVESR